MNKLLNAFLGLFLLGFVSACGTSGGVVTPQTPEQQVAVAYGLYTTLANTAADMLELGTISVSQAQSIQGKLGTARQALDHLKALTSDGRPLPSTEVETLQLVQQLLIQLQLELQQRTPQ